MQTIFTIMSTSYNRNTELRHVHTKDLYKLAVILDDENYWKKLMEIIPREINNQSFGTKEDSEKIVLGASYQRKYSNDQIRLIENVIRRPGESRLYAEILFDEWGTSGRKHERPTLGVLLHLLVQSKLYRAADFVAELLNETKPPRPSNGPAAAFEFQVDVFKDIQEVLNDTRFYPNTEDLQENINNDINIDYYAKYNKTVDKGMGTIDENTEEPKVSDHPKPPPRLVKSKRLINQQQSTANINIQNDVQEYSSQNPELDNLSNNENIPLSSFAASNNIPILSALNNTRNCEVTRTTTIDNITASENPLPNLSALNNSSSRIIMETSGDDNGDDSLSSTPSLIYTNSNIVEYNEDKNPNLNSIPIVVLSTSLNSDSKSEELNSYNINTQDLPAISALNLSGEKDTVNQYQQKQDYLENLPIVSFTGNNTIDSNVPSFLESMNYNHNFSKHQLDAIEEDYNGIEQDGEFELDDDEDSIPNLSFLDNRSSNNESSLTNVTNTSGENSFDQSVNDCSSTSNDNVPCLSVLNH